MNQPELLAALRIRRRDRLARTGRLGPTVKALHDVADLLELERRARRRADHGTTDYILLMRVCYGPLMAWNPRTGRYDFAPCPLCGSTLRDRRHRPAGSLEAAETLLAEVIGALGTESGTPVTRVRAIADEMASAVMQDHV